MGQSDAQSCSDTLSDSLEENRFENGEENSHAGNALKAEWGKRREVLLKEKIDYTGFQVWFVENWPKLIEVMRNAEEEYWEQLN